MYGEREERGEKEEEERGVKGEGREGREGRGGERCKGRGEWREAMSSGNLLVFDHQAEYSVSEYFLDVTKDMCERFFFLFIILSTAHYLPLQKICGEDNIPNRREKRRTRLRYISFAYTPDSLANLRISIIANRIKYFESELEFIYAEGVLVHHDLRRHANMNELA